MTEFEDSLKYYRDLKNSLDTARQEGKIEGRKEGRKEGEKKGKKEVARNLLKSGVPLDVIVRSTGLSEDEIKSLK
jgi:predicted transposase/invertase (TIGR01784 family)